MKKILLIGLIALGGMQGAVAIAEAPADPVLIREDRVWEYYYQGRDCIGSEESWSITRYKFDGTEERGDKTYHRWVALDREYWGTPHGYNPDGSWNWQVKSETLGNCEALLREEAGVVYMLLEHDKVGEYTIGEKYPVAHEIQENEEVVLYDFNLNTGDTGKTFVSDFKYDFYETPQPGLENCYDYITEMKVTSAYNDSKLPGNPKVIEADNGLFRNYLENWDAVDPGFNMTENSAEYIAMKYIEGVGNVCWGDMTNFGGTSEFYTHITSCGSSDELWLNNVYDLDGKVVYNGINRTAPYNKMISEDRVWEYMSYQYNDYDADRENPDPYADCSLTRYRFNGTEEVGDKTYHKLYVTEKTSWQTPSTQLDVAKGEIEKREINECIALLREEKGKVYILLEGDEVKTIDETNNTFTVRPIVGNEEALLYDFNVETGNTFVSYIDIFDEGNVLMPVIVDKCEEIKPDYQHTFTKISLTQSDKIKDMDLYVDVNYVVGVGNTGDGNLIDLGTHEYPEPECYCYGGEFFNNLYDLDGKVIYKGADMQPEVAGVEAVGVDADEDAPIYDLNGVRVDRPQRGGVYVRNGKKFIGK